MTPIEHWRTLDEQGNVFPWYTRPCLEWLNTLDLNGKRVFEYGCGASTDWYKSRGAITYGVDDKKEWIPDECGYRVTTNIFDYLNFICTWNTKFDLVIIDGLFRDTCTVGGLLYLKKGGYLIADNFEQDSAGWRDWPKTRELTKNLPLTLYKEPEHKDWVTAVWQNE